jgi:exodeoxyribonuclease VII small subunit
LYTSPRLPRWPARKPSISLTELQTLVERLESGELSLEESLGAFEQGIRLTRECQTSLSQAEQKVQILLERDGELSEAPFDAEGDEA